MMKCGPGVILFETKRAGVYARAVTHKLISYILQKERDSTDAWSIQWKITKEFAVLREQVFQHVKLSLMAQKTASTFSLAVGKKHRHCLSV